MASPVVSIEHVVLSFASGDSVKSTDLTKGQTLAKCVPMMISIEVNGDSATVVYGGDGKFGLEIYNNGGTPAVRATRGFSANNVLADVSVYIWEFTSDCNVYSGSFSSSGDSNVASIGATVDTSKAFVVCTTYDTVSNVSQDDNAYATNFFSTTQIESQRAATGAGTWYGYWYVVEDNTAKTLFDVRHATLTLSSTQPVSATVGSFTLSKSILLADGYSNFTALDQRISSATAWIEGTTTVKAQRNSTSSTLTITMFTQIIEFQDDAVVVDRGSSTLGSTTDSANHSLSKTFSANASAHVTHSSGWLGCVNTALRTAASTIPDVRLRGQLDSTRDGIDILRDYKNGTQTVTYNWEAIDFGAGKQRRIFIS